PAHAYLSLVPFRRTLLTSMLSFFLSCSRAHRDLHSFPTRRSSDLSDRRRRAGESRASSTWRRSSGGRRKVAIEAMLMIKQNHPADRKSTRLNSSHLGISYAVFCLKKKKKQYKKKKKNK